MQPRIAAIAAATLIVLSSNAYGRDLIQMDFDGVVTQAGFTTGASLILDDPLHARVVFDAEGVDYDSSPLVGLYQYEFMEVFTNRGLVFRTGQSPPGSLNGLVIDRSRQEFDEFRFIGTGAFTSTRSCPFVLRRERSPTTARRRACRSQRRRRRTSRSSTHLAGHWRARR